jgi:hypothetical protein
MTDPTDPQSDFNAAFDRFEEATQNVIRDLESYALEHTVFREEIAEQAAATEQARLEAERQCRQALNAVGVTPFAQEAVLRMHRGRDDDWWNDDATIAIATTLGGDEQLMTNVYGPTWREVAAVCAAITALSERAIEHWRRLIEDGETIESQLKVIEQILERCSQQWDPDDRRFEYCGPACSAVSNTVEQILATDSWTSSRMADLPESVIYAVLFADAITQNECAALVAPWDAVVQRQ